jgi:hypothetical protein
MKVSFYSHEVINYEKQPKHSNLGAGRKARYVIYVPCSHYANAIFAGCLINLYACSWSLEGRGRATPTVEYPYKRL